MRHNKVLGAAIATALCLGTGSAYAGELTIYHYDYSTTSLVEGAPTFASEFFVNNNPRVPDGEANDDNLSTSGWDSSNSPPNLTGILNDNYIYAEYVVTEALSTNFLAHFVLNGATFGADVDLSTNGADFVGNPTNTIVPVTFSTVKGAGGREGDSQATFLVQASGQPLDDQTIVFRFTLQDAESLAKSGGKVDLTVHIYGPGGEPEIETPAPTKTVATSANGLEVAFATPVGSTEVDVGTGGINFVGDIISPTMASLGTLNIADASSAPLKDDGTAWVFGTDDPKPVGATLTIVNGNFAASIAEPGVVFLDTDGNGIYDASTSTDINDIAASEVTESEATWNLDLAQVNKLKGSTVPIVIQADGTTQINDNNDPPQATLSIDMGSGQTIPFGKKLRQIKRNGTVCTLYNVPNPKASDNGFIRTTNTSSKEGKILGTLRVTTCNTATPPVCTTWEIFTNQEVIPAIAINETKVVKTNTDEPPATAIALDEVGPKNQAWLDYWTAPERATEAPINPYLLDDDPSNDSNGWPGRAVLTFSSDLPTMEVFGLVRNRTGGPLTNMSTGATGNGCD